MVVVDCIRGVFEHEEKMSDRPEARGPICTCRGTKSIPAREAGLVPLVPTPRASRDWLNGLD